MKNSSFRVSFWQDFVLTGLSFTQYSQWSTEDNIVRRGDGSCADWVDLRHRGRRTRERRARRGQNWRTSSADQTSVRSWRVVGRSRHVSDWVSPRQHTKTNCRRWTHHKSSPMTLRRELELVWTARAAKCHITPTLRYGTILHRLHDLCLIKRLTKRTSITTRVLEQYRYPPAKLSHTHILHTWRRPTELRVTHYTPASLLG